MTSPWGKAWRRFRRQKVALVSLAVLGALILLAIFAPWFVGYSPLEVNAESLQLAPSLSSSHFLGTDDLGRDLWSRLVYGARLSLSIGALAVVVSLGIGTPLGLWAGFKGGWIDQVIMRLTDMLMSLPNILLAIVLVTVLGPGLNNTVWAVSVVAIPSVIRVIRAVTMVEKERVYAQAARAYGAGDLRLVLRHLVPNSIGPLMVQATLGFSDAILNAAALGFLGLGAQPPTPEWGVMLADSRPYLETAWWMVTLPGLCLVVASLCFNLLGDGLREALDPKVATDE